MKELIAVGVVSGAAALVGGYAFFRKDKLVAGEAITLSAEIDDRPELSSAVAVTLSAIGPKSHIETVALWNRLVAEHHLDINEGEIDHSLTALVKIPPELGEGCLIKYVAAEGGRYLPSSAVHVAYAYGQV